MDRGEGTSKLTCNGRYLEANKRPIYGGVHDVSLSIEKHSHLRTKQNLDDALSGLDAHNILFFISAIHICVALQSS